MKTHMQKLKYWFAVMVFMAGIGTTAIIFEPQTASAVVTEPRRDDEVDNNYGIEDAGIRSKCEGRLLTIPVWYRGLTDANCNIVYPGGSNQSSEEARATLGNFIWTIALNVVEILLHIVGYLAVGFIIYGGFTYLISTGQPDKLSSAKNTITNAIVGLIISIFAIAIVNLVVGIF